MMIEGIGDEVVQFVGVLFIFSIAALAWWSTNARPGRYRTVVIMRSRAHPVTVSIRTRPNAMITNNPATSSTSSSDSSIHELASDTRETSSVVPTLQEMDSIIDADVAMFNNNRLHFYRRVDSATDDGQNTEETVNEDNESRVESEPSSNAQIREMDSIVSAMEADVTTGCEFFTRPTETNDASGKKSVRSVNNNNPSTTSNEDKQDKEETNATSDAAGETASGDTTDGDTRKILIKLKYLNDTHKEVECSLDEQLKDFKLRNFSSELSSECRVRLIFNGRVLVEDGATLQACGLYHRAVVHCLVHPKRPIVEENNTDESPASPELVTEGPPQDRPWDLENILMTLVSVALTVVWFFRCEYSNMFTASASVALFGLTVFYSVAVFGLYMTDTFHSERRPRAVQIVPAN